MFRAAIHGSSSRALLAVDHLARRRAGSGRGRLRPVRGVRTAAKHRAVDMPLALEEAHERADAGEPARQRPRAGAVVPPRRHEGAEVGDAQVSNSASPGGPARWRGEELQELLDVARIGLDRLRRHPPFAGELPPPALDLAQEVGGAVYEGTVFIRGAEHGL